MGAWWETESEENRAPAQGQAPRPWWEDRRPWWEREQAGGQPGLGRPGLDQAMLSGPNRSPFAPPAEVPSNFFEYWWQGAKRRVEEAWKKPEERRFLPPVEGPSLMERARRLQELPMTERIPQALLQAPSVILQAAGEPWDVATRESGLLRGVEQLLGAGAAALGEPANLLEQATGALAISARPESKGLEFSQWAPLTERTWSLAWQQAQERLGLREKPKGRESISEAWGRDVLGNALRAIGRGEKTAQQIAAEEEMLGPELVGQVFADPLNLIDAVGIGKKVQAGKALSNAEKMVLAGADDAKLLAEADELGRRMALVAKGETAALEQAAKAAGEVGRPGVWRRLRDLGAKPFELVPEAKADRDLSEMWIVASGPLSEVKTADQALDVVRRWADAPETLGQLGGTVNSPAGKKAGTIFHYILDQVDELPSVQAARVGEQFNPGRFLVEVTGAAEQAVRQAYGAKAPGRIGRFLEGYKGLQSELYLTAIYSPGYVMRNVASDLFTMAVDGVGTFERRTHLDDFFKRLGVTSKRVTTEGRGAREALTGIAEGESRLPGVFGEISKKGQEITRHAEIGGVLPIGEEPRYQRAYYSVLKRFLDANALEKTPDLPAAIRVVLGDQAADHLREAVARGLNLNEKRAALERVLEARTPGQGLSVTRYLDAETMDAMSPEMFARLEKRLGELPMGADETSVRGIVDEARGWVDEWEGEALRGSEVVPGRKVASEAEEAELAEAIVTDLRREAQRLGDPQLMRQVGELAARIQDLEAQLADARAIMVEMARAAGDANPERGADVLEVLLAANRDTDRLRDTTRARLDKLMGEAREQYRKLGPEAGNQIWPPYFSQAAQGWDEAAVARIARFQEASDQVRRVMAGEPVEAVLGLDRQALAELRLRGATIPEDLEQFESVEDLLGWEPGSVLDVRDAAKYDEFLRVKRQMVDAASNNAWRAGFRARPEQSGDVLDILDSAARDVEFYGRRAASEVAIARQALLDEVEAIRTSGKGKVGPQIKAAAERYYKERNRLWGAYFEQARSRWSGVEIDLGRLEGVAPAGSPVAPVRAGAAPVTRRAPSEEAARLGPGLRSGVMNPEGTAKVQYRRPATAGEQFEIDYIGSNGKVIETRLANTEREAQYLADMGQREADLWARSVASGAEPSVVGLHDVPQGSATVKVNKRGARWELAYYDTEGRVLEAYDFGANYGPAKAAKNRAEVILKQRARGIAEGAKAETEGVNALDRAIEEARAATQPWLPKGTAQAGRAVEGVDVGRAEAVLNAERRAAHDAAATAKGAGEAPAMAGLVQSQAAATRRALDAIEAGLVGDWGTWQPVVADAATRRALEQWLSQAVTPAWFETRATALQYAKARADFALLDYAKRRRFDTWLSYVTPYSYWYTRSGWNWGQRLMSRPGLLSAYIDTRDAMKLANEQAGRRQRFDNKVRIPFPWLPDWMGDAIYVDPLRFMVPFAAYEGTNWDDADDSRSTMQRIVDGARRLGIRPYHFLEFPFQTGMVARAGEAMGMSPEQAQAAMGPETPGGFGFVLPQTRLIRSATALAREAGIGQDVLPPGGLDIEAPLRRMAGLPAGEAWDPYRVGRMVANMAAEKPQDVGLARAALMAQELLRRDETQTGRTWSPDSELAQQVAEEQGWTAAELARAQALLATAMQRAVLEQGVGSLGWALGPSMAIEPAGERARIELANRAAVQTYAPAGYEPGTPAGSRAAYQQFQRENPALYAHSTQYSLVPGDTSERMEPGARANWLARKEATDRIYEQYQRKVDELLRKRPWDSKGRSALLQERAEKVAEAEAKYPLPEMTGDIPPILYGQNPAEMWDAVVEDEIRKAEESKPDAAEFETADGVDWSAYYEAEDAWRAGLPATFGWGGLPEAGTYRGMSPSEAVDAYARRFDSPLEAALKTYQEVVASPAWDAYDRAKAQIEARWPGLFDAQEAYFNLPAGQQRRDYLSQHPELKAYWDYKEKAGSPYERTVGRVKATKAVSLIPEILQAYQGRGWTEAELRKALAGTVFPALSKQSSPSPQPSPPGGEGAKLGPSMAAGELPAGPNGDWLGAARAMYGPAWFERRTGGGRSRGGGGGYGRSPWVPPRWEEGPKIYGGPRFSKG